MLQDNHLETIMAVYLKEHSQYSYQPRTKFNADNSDLTIAFTVDQFTAGERLTRKLATEMKYMHINLHTVSPACAARDIHNRIASQFKGACNIINIAGNGVYTLTRHKWMQGDANQYLFDTFSVLKDKWGNMPVKGFRSGGQTGVDIAAAVMAYALGADAVITFPKSYRQRGVDGQDFVEKREDVMMKVIAMDKQLKKDSI